MILITYHFSKILDLLLTFQIGKLKPTEIHRMLWYYCSFMYCVLKFHI